MLKINVKKSTSAEYERRINRAIEFIVCHLDETMQLDDIAKASHFSPFHFHRIFHALAGETVNNFVTRKRMEKAAKKLVYHPSLSITDVAMTGGYSSGANFSKAFKLYFGLSPSELRNGQFKIPNDLNITEKKFSKYGKLFRKYGKVFDPQEMYSQLVTQSRVFDLGKLEDQAMQINVNDIEEKSIAFLTAPNGYELSSIYETWDKIIHWAKLKGINVGVQDRFAICHDNPSITPVNKCRYDAAIEIKADTEVSSPYQQSIMPSGKYAVAYYKDDANNINQFIAKICSQWLPDSGYEPDDYPPVFNYLNDSRQDGFVEMNVYIKVKVLALS